MTARQQEIIDAATASAQDAPTVTNDVDRQNLAYQAMILYDHDDEHNLTGLTGREATLFQTTFCAAHVRIMANHQRDAAKADYADIRAFLERQIAAMKHAHDNDEAIDAFVTAAKDFLTNH